MNKISFKTLNFFFLIFIGLMLSIIAGLRPLKYFMDTEMYVFMINTYKDMFDSEPTFWIINQFNQILFEGNIQTFFLIYAIIGISIKIFAISNISLYPLFSMFTYFCLYFILYDMTAIRASVAIGFFLWAIPDILNKNFKSYLFKTIFAILFHYSALIMFFLYFINPDKINKKFYFIVPIIFFLLSFMSDNILIVINYLSSLFPVYVEWKIKAYITLLEDSTYNTINRFNPFILSLCIIYYISLFNMDKFEQKISILLVKLLGLQISVFYLFYSIPPMAGRISQFIGISLVFLIPLFINIFKDKFISYSLISLWLIIYFVSTIIKYTLLF